MAKPPNILWVVTTQWRGQALGCAGDRNARTPFLDALAASSQVFRAAVTPHPFGPFARAALLTGLPCPQNGVQDYFDPLPRETRTIAHRLRERGYATGFFGKWHLAARDPQAPLVGEAHARMIVPEADRGGFEFWEGFESGFLLNDPWLHGTRLPEPRQLRGYQSDIVCERAMAWVRAQPGPWFCVISLEPPHPPYAARSGRVSPQDPAALELAPNVPRGGPVEARARRELAGYYAHIEATDAALGRHVGTEPAAREAALVFTSVHGDMHGAHGRFRKGWPYEESIRVPLLLRPPSGVGTTGGRRDAPVSLIELAGWAEAWAERRAVSVGEPPGTRLDGVLISMPSVVTLPDQCDCTWQGLRTAGRKLVLRDGAPWLFFDLERDPWERNNLASVSAHADEIAALRARIPG